MRLERLETALVVMSEKALIRLVKRCVCQTLVGVGEVANEARQALDLIYVECSRRGKEKLYDTVCVNVAQHPERCQLH